MGNTYQSMEFSFPLNDVYFFNIHVKKNIKGINFKYRVP